MSQDDYPSEAYGITPYAPERHDELAAEAHSDEMLQTSDEAILVLDEANKTV